MSTELPIDPLLKDTEAASMLGVSRRTFWRFVSDGSVPKPVRLGRNVSRWPRSEIFAALDAAKAARSHAA